MSTARDFQAAVVARLNFVYVRNIWSGLFEWAIIDETEPKVLEKITPTK